MGRPSKDRLEMIREWDRVCFVKNPSISDQFIHELLAEIDELGGDNKSLIKRVEKLRDALKSCNSVANSFKDREDAASIYQVTAFSLAQDVSEKTKP